MSDSTYPLNVPCSWCKASEGRFCKTRSGHVTRAHQMRVNFARIVANVMSRKKAKAA